MDLDDDWMYDEDLLLETIGIVSFGMDGRISWTMNRLFGIVDELDEGFVEWIVCTGGLVSRLAIGSVFGVSDRMSTDRISSMVSFNWAIVSSIVFDSSTECRNLRFTPPESESTSSEW